MDSRNFLSLDYTDNPDLADIFARTNIGDDACLRIKFQIKTKDAAGVTGSISEIEDDSEDSDYPKKKKKKDEDSSDDYEDSGVVKPNPKEPMMVEMSVNGPLGG